MLRAVGAAETCWVLGRRAETFSTLRRQARAAGRRGVKNRAKSRGRESSIAVPRDAENLRAAEKKNCRILCWMLLRCRPSLSLSLSLRLQMRALRVRHACTSLRRRVNETSDEIDAYISRRVLEARDKREAEILLFPFADSSRSLNREAEASARAGERRESEISIARD